MPRRQGRPDEVNGSAVPAGPAATPFGWRRGLGIVALLALAFIAASATGRVADGLEEVTLAAVSAALLVAALACALPPLVRGLRRDWKRRVGQRPRGTQVRVTAAGLPFLGALIILVAAAVNSGNNLIYLVVAALLGALVTSGIFSAFNLAGLTLDLEWPEHAFAGQPAPVRLRLGNQKRLLPSYSLRLAASSTPVAVEMGRGWRKRRAAAPGAAMQAAYFAYVPARRNAAATSDITFPRRGRYAAAAFSLSTRFPFGLLEKRRRFRPLAAGDAGASLVVYPAVTTAPEGMSAWAVDGAHLAAAQTGAGEDLYRLRPHAAGDSLRLVHWKASAKTGELRVREFSRDQDQRLRVVVALAPGWARAEQIEKAIERCASLIWAAVAAGDWIEFTGANAAPGFAPGGGAEAAGAGRAWTPPPLPAAEALHPVLRYLALLDPAGPVAPLPPVSQAGPGERWFLAHRGQAPGLPAGALRCVASEL